MLQLTHRRGPGIVKEFLPLNGASELAVAVKQSTIIFIKIGFYAFSKSWCPPPMFSSSFCNRLYWFQEEILVFIQHVAEGSPHQDAVQDLCSGLVERQVVTSVLYKLGSESNNEVIFFLLF